MRMWYRKKKYLKKKVTESSPNLAKDKLINPTHSVCLKKGKREETQAQIQCNQTVKREKKKKKISKAVREK